MDVNVDRKALALHSLLRDAPLFAGLTQEGFSGLAQVLHERRLRRGEVLFHRGAPGISLVIVCQGRLEVQMDGDSPPAAPVRLGPGAVTGEMSCIDPAPRSATVVAEEDCLVYELTHPALRGLYHDTPQVAVTIVGGAIHQLTGRLRETGRRISQVLADGAHGSRTMGRPEPEGVQARAQPEPYRGPLDLLPLRAQRGLTEADLQVLLRVAPPLRYPDGALLFREGTPAASGFLVCSGCVELLRRQQAVATAGPGALLGYLALVEAGQRRASAWSRGDAVALELRREDFTLLLCDFSPLAMRLQEQVAVAGIRQLRAATRHLEAVLRAGKQADPADLEALQAVLHEWPPLPKS